MTEKRISESPGGGDDPRGQVMKTPEDVEEMLRPQAQRQGLNPRPPLTPAAARPTRARADSCGPHARLGLTQATPTGGQICEPIGVTFVSRLTAQDVIRRLRVMLPERSLDWHLLRIRRCFYPPHLHDEWRRRFTDAWNATPIDPSGAPT